MATSPVVALRFHLDALAADLEADNEQAERELLDATAQRANLLQQLRRNEESRRQALSAQPLRPAQVVRAMHDGLSLVDEMARLESRIQGLRRHIDDIAESRRLLRTLSDGVRTSAPGSPRFDERSERLSRASRSMYRLVEEEHEQLALAVLDGPMQRLSEACFEAEVAERLVGSEPEVAQEHAARCRERAVAAVVALDRLATALRPVTAHRGLVEALRQLLATSTGEERSALRVIGAERRLPLLSETALFRIVQEAVANASKHGRPSRIDVVLSYHPEQVVLVVKDDGEGFDVVATEARLGRTGGLGIIKMQEHAALVGSRLEIKSLIGAGTEVRATLRQPA